jgi:hypothetical protein
MCGTFLVMHRRVSSSLAVGFHVKNIESFWLLYCFMQLGRYLFFCSCCHGIYCKIALTVLLHNVAAHNKNLLNIFVTHKQHNINVT